MLDAIRKRSGSIAVKLLLFLLILSFGLWGVNDVFFQQAQRATVVVVGDSEILGIDVEQAVSREISRLQRLTGGRVDITQARNLGIVDSVVEQMVTRNLYSQAARDLGLTVSDPLIRENISQNPNFRGTTGTFDTFTFRQVLQNNSLNEALYVNQLRDDLIRAQLLNSVSAGANAPQAMAEAMYRYANEQRVADTVFVRDADMPTPTDPGDSGLRAFRDENSAQFTAPEHRKVTAVVLTADELAKEIAIPEDDLMQAFEDRRHEFTTPESRKVRQMVLANKDEADRAHGLLTQGRGFAEVAKDLAGLDEASLELGDLTRPEMLPEMADAAFALDNGAFTQPVESPLGWHIIQVTDITVGNEPTFSDTRDELTADIAREKAIDSLFDLSNDLEDALGGGASLEEASRQLNVPLLAVESVDATGRDAEGSPVTDLPQTNRFLDVAFQTPQGEESQLEEGGTDSYFILRVDKVTPPALRPFDRVRTDVLAAWQAAQRSEAAEEKGNSLLASLVGSGGDLATIAKEAGLSVETTEPMRRNVEGAGPPQALRDMLFATDRGAYTVARGNGGFYVAQTKEIIAARPSSERAAVENLSQQLTNSIRTDLMQQFSGALRNEYTVGINNQVLDELFY